MTHFLQRTAILLLGTSALCAGPAVARADFASPGLVRVEHALDVRGAGAEPELILAANRHRRARSSAPPATYEVKRGDTLDRIAGRLGVTVSELKAANGLKRSTIQPGDVLKNPKARVAKARTSSRSDRAERSGRAGRGASTRSSDTYTVARGDTLFSISKKFGVSLADLREANGLSSRGQIHAGQKLALPGSAVSAEEQADERVAEEMARRAARGGRGPAEVEEASDGGFTRSATGRVITIPGRAVTYTVKRGDNLDRIARRLDTTVAELRKDNGLKRGAIRPGQRLKGPPGNPSKAYVAASGDSLDTIARRFGVTSAALRAENGLSRRAGVRPGQRLRLPDGYRDRGPVSVATRTPAREPEVSSPRPQPQPQPQLFRPAPSTDAPISTGLPSQPQPYTPTPGVRPYTPPPARTPPVGAPVAAPAVSDAQISQLGRGRFVWPVQGAVLSDYGPKAGGQRNDGLNIQAEAGATVRAAASGDVVYAGDQVPGFGNLVLIKHAEGWVTAYGHLSHVDVKMQQKVTQGQQIGQAGSTGGVPEPQLHFEIRYAPSPLERARPIDPKLVLPR